MNNNEIKKEFIKIIQDNDLVLYKNSNNFVLETRNNEQKYGKQKNIADLNSIHQYNGELDIKLELKVFLIFHLLKKFEMKELLKESEFDEVNSWDYIKNYWSIFDNNNGYVVLSNMPKISNKYDLFNVLDSIANDKLLTYECKNRLITIIIPKGSFIYNKNDLNKIKLREYLKTNFHSLLDNFKSYYEINIDTTNIFEENVVNYKKIAINKNVLNVKYSFNQGYLGSELSFAILSKIITFLNKKEILSLLNFNSIFFGEKDKKNYFILIDGQSDKSLKIMKNFITDCFEFGIHNKQENIFKTRKNIEKNLIKIFKASYSKSKIENDLNEKNSNKNKCKI